MIEQEARKASTVNKFVSRFESKAPNFLIFNDLYNADSSFDKAAVSSIEKLSSAISIFWANAIIKIR